MGMTPPKLYRAALCFLLIGGALPGPARAEPTEAERMARWSDLRHAIFGDRVVEDTGNLVTIDAPARAADAAIVPVAISIAEPLAPEIRGLYLMIIRRRSRRTFCSDRSRTHERSRRGSASTITPTSMPSPKPRTVDSTWQHGSSRRPAAARHQRVRIRHLLSSVSER